MRLQRKLRWLLEMKSAQLIQNCWHNLLARYGPPPPSVHSLRVRNQAEHATPVANDKASVDSLFLISPLVPYLTPRQAAAPFPQPCRPVPLPPNPTSRAAKLLVIMMRIERERNLAAKCIQRSCRNAVYIRHPINRRADARRRMTLLRNRHEYARRIQVTPLPPRTVLHTVTLFEVSRQANGSTTTCGEPLTALTTLTTLEPPPQQDAYTKHHNYAAYLVRRDKERERRRKMPGASTAIACAYRRYRLRMMCRTLLAARRYRHTRFLRKFTLNVLAQREKRRRNEGAQRIQVGHGGQGTSQARSWLVRLRGGVPE
jgi:hypothetical protein